MRISAIIKIALNYILLGVIGLAFVSIIFGIGYFLIYKKLLKGTKHLKLSNLYYIKLVKFVTGMGLYCWSFSKYA